MKSPSIPHPMYGNTFGHVYGLQTQNSLQTYPCVARQTPAVSADGGSKKCTSTKESPVSVTFHPTWNRESHTYTRMDMQRQVNRSTGESSSPQDSQTTRISCRTDNMKRIFPEVEAPARWGLGRCRRMCLPRVPQNKTLR